MQLLQLSPRQAAGEGTVVQRSEVTVEVAASAQCRLHCCSFWPVATPAVTATLSSSALLHPQQTVLSCTSDVQVAVAAVRSRYEAKRETARSQPNHWLGPLFLLLQRSRSRSLCSATITCPAHSNRFLH